LLKNSSFDRFNYNKASLFANNAEADKLCTNKSENIKKKTKTTFTKTYCNNNVTGL